jgi:hypothetical protein
MLYGHTTTAAGPVVGKYVRVYRRPAGGGHWSLVARRAGKAPTGWYSTSVHPRRSTTYKVVSFASPFYRAASSGLVTVRVAR